MVMARKRFSDEDVCRKAGISSGHFTSGRPQMIHFHAT